MASGRKLAALIVPALVASGQPAAQPEPPPPGGVIANIDLTRLFAARTPWRFVATQGPPVDDPVWQEKLAGEVRLCLEKAAAGICGKQLEAMPAGMGDYAAARTMREAKVVWPTGTAAPPVPFVQTASRGEIDQAVFTQVFAYRAQRDEFVRVYAHATGRNNNQEVRYVSAGRLRGSVISAEPTANAPYGYWITVSRPGRDDAYRQVLRYRSATRYGDGNALAVIDSEMPGIEQRLGLWRPGAPLPLPAGGCAHPRLDHGELWCGARPAAEP